VALTRAIWVIFYPLYFLRKPLPATLRLRHVQSTPWINGARMDGAGKKFLRDSRFIVGVLLSGQRFPFSLLLQPVSEQMTRTWPSRAFFS